MDTNLTLRYDQLGDILYLDTRPPYPEQESEELDYGVIARLNPHTQEIETLELLFFSQRILQGNLFQLPILARLQPHPYLSAMSAEAVAA